MVEGFAAQDRGTLVIATEVLAETAGLVALPCYRWTHVVVVPPDHVLAREAEQGRTLTLRRLADFPLITYEGGYTGRSHIDQAFARHGLKPDVVLAAMDADVIKTYVELGMGVGLVASIAYDESRDLDLRAIDTRHLFAASMTRLALRRSSYLRRYAYEFIRCFASPLTPELVERAMREAAGEGEADGGDEFEI